MDNTGIIQSAWETIGDNTPLKTDCGELCGHACCLPDEDGQGGVYLFPGEEALIGCDIPFGHIDTVPGFGETDSLHMLTCTSPCDRNRRPLACRIFPLTPYLNSKGVWTVRIDARARAMCPLTRSGVAGLSPEFTHSVKKALRQIAKTPEGESFLKDWQSLESQYNLIL